MASPHGFRTSHIEWDLSLQAKALAVDTHFDQLAHDRLYFVLA